MSARPVFQNLSPDKQQAILHAAMREFAGYGYHQASINRIVAELSIAKGSIFQYFGNKLGLFEHVFAQAKDLVAESVRLVRDQTPDDDFFTRLEIVTQAGLHFVRTHPRVYRIYLHVLHDEHLPKREYFLDQVRTASSAFLSGLVNHGMARGDLSPDLNTQWTVMYLDALLDRFLQVMSRPQVAASSGTIPSGTDREHIQALVQFVRNGLRPRPEAGS